MSASVLPPTAPTTLVILIGASAWPNSPGFQASSAFVHAAQGFRNYLLDPRGFGLATANLLDLFDAQTSSSDQLELLGSFLEERTQALKTANQTARDVLVYFVGHGGFAGPSADFYLLLHRTNASSLRASGLAIDALAEVLREKARQVRRYLFLDCCFAAAAFRAFQGGPDQTAITKTLDAFAVQARSSGFPRRGTVLLCSSDQKSPSLLLPDASCTMFSSALLDVLKNGDLHRPRQLSLRDLKELAEDRLAALPEKNAPRPGLHSPDQSEGDVADVPFFPNPRAQAAISPPYRATLPHPPTPKQPKRLRTPFVVTLILLILLLFGGGSLGIYRAATGNWLWNASAPAENPNPYPPNRGTLLLLDPLSQPLHWEVTSECHFRNGAYHVTGSCLSSLIIPGDFAFEVQMAILPSGYSPPDCGSAGYSSGVGKLLILTICTGGHYGYTLNIGSQQPEITSPGTLTSSAIRQGHNQNNLIGIVFIGHTATFYVNHQRLDSVTNNAITPSEGQLIFTPPNTNVVPVAELVFHDERIWAL